MKFTGVSTNMSTSIPWSTMSTMFVSTWLPDLDTDKLIYNFIVFQYLNNFCLFIPFYIHSPVHHNLILSVCLQDEINLIFILWFCNSLKLLDVIVVHVHVSSVWMLYPLWLPCHGFDSSPKTLLTLSFEEGDKVKSVFGLEAVTWQPLWLSGPCSKLKYACSIPMHTCTWLSPHPTTHPWILGWHDVSSLYRRIVVTISCTNLC